MSSCRRRYILTVILLLVSPAMGDATWHDDFYPHRISIKLPSQTAGTVRINLSTKQILDELAKVSLEPINERTLAFDRAILVDPTSGTLVGGFKLVAAGPALEIEGDFAKLFAGQSSKWTSSAGSAKVSFENVEDQDQKFRAIQIESTALANQSVKQPVSLKKDGYYLLDYRLRGSMKQGYAAVILNNPAKWFFSELPGSYHLKLTPEEQWTHHQVLYQADAENCELKIDCGYVGKASIGVIQCSPVEWALIANLQKPAASLDLYLVASAGHFYVQPTNQILSKAAPARSVDPSIVSAELADMNPDGVRLALGDGIEAWTVPTYLPLRAETIGRTRPRHLSDGRVNDVYRASVLRGESTTILIAIETAGTAIRVSEAKSSLPLQTKFQRLASLDLFDSFFPKGKRTESRYDPMVDLDFALTPPDRNGIQMIACTLTAPPDAKPGRVEGSIELKFQTQVPREKSLVLPIELTVLSPRVQPTKHFGTIFGMNQFTSFFEKRDPVFVDDSTTIARFHGYKQPDLRDTFISRISRPDTREPNKAVLLPLAWKYFHTLLDFDIIPQGLTLFSFYDYQIVDQGEGKAPLLKDWTFTAFDKAVDEFVVKRDVPNLVIWHTNGHLMDFLHLADGSVWSTRAKPADESGSWHVLPKDEYLKLLGDYFDTLCEHLDQRGLADRAVLVIDESDETTYPLMYEIRKALKSRPYAKKMRWSHTTYKTSIYTDRLPDGKLIMDEVLDFPMPDNDDHFNFTEKEWYSRLKSSPEKSKWVYYVETDHLNLDAAGLSTVITPLKLRTLGVDGWYCWAAMLWSLPYKNEDFVGIKYPQGQMVNPWLNPYNNHGHGATCFFYPPDPRGPADEPTDRVIPSYRLHMIRDGIQDRALLEVLNLRKDDAGETLQVDTEKLAAADAEFAKLWAANPVQWYISPEAYRKGRQLLHEACR